MHLNEPYKSKKEIDDLVWGGQGPKTTYELWSITAVKGRCGQRTLDELLTDLKLLEEWQEKITFNMPIAFMIMLSILDFYLLVRSSHNIYILTLIVSYGYMSFSVIAFSFLAKYALEDSDFTSYGCIGQNWFILLNLFPVVLNTMIVDFMTLMYHVWISMHWTIF